MKRTAVTIGILLALAYTAFAANIPPLTGPQDPSQLQATINQLVQSVNSNVGMPGYVGGLPAATTGTTIQQLGLVNLPGGVLNTVGKGLRISCYGTGTATGTNTLTVQVGTATAFAVAGTATTAGVFRSSVMLMKTGPSTQQIWSDGVFNLTGIQPTLISATQVDTATIPIQCEGTSTTTGNFTLNAMIVETLQ